MIWIVGLVLAGLLVAVVFSLVVAIVMAIVELVLRVALGACLAIASGVVAGVAAEWLGWDGTLIGAAVATLGFVPAVLLVGRWRSSGLQRKVAVKRSADPSPPVTPLDPHGQAWTTACALAPTASLETARDASMQVLALSRAHALVDPDILDCATILRRHVPALVSETEALIATLSCDERSGAIRELVADLRALGAQAADVLARRKAGVREKLAVRRARLFGMEGMV